MVNTAGRGGLGSASQPEGQDGGCKDKNPTLLILVKGDEDYSTVNSSQLNFFHFPFFNQISKDFVPREFGVCEPLKKLKTCRRHKNIWKFMCRILGI